MVSKAMIQYIPLNREGIKKVILCDESDQDYQEWFDFIIKKGQTESQKKKQLRIKEYKEKYDLFEKIYSYVIDEGFYIKYVIYPQKICGTCGSSDLDKYRPNTQNAMVCWNNWVNGLPKRTWSYQSACLDYSLKWNAEGSFIIKDGEHDEVFSKKVSGWILNLCAKSEDNKLEDDEKLILATHLSEMNIPTLHLKVMLRDCLGYDFSKIKIGKKAKQLEKELQEYIELCGYKINKKIFKIYYENNFNPRFKIMDAYLKINNNNYIIEIFTYGRNIEEKIQQINDYEYLLKLTGEDNTKKYLIEYGLSEDDSTWEKIPDDITLCSPEDFMVALR